jgi:L-ascorbate metabolism protein UlaG (beta-lactamase superfamily)
MNILKSFVLILLLFSSALTQEWEKEPILFTPISHATFAIQTSEKTIFVDPVGNVETYSSFSAPDIILITDIHGDHLSQETVNALKKNHTIIVAPKAVVDQLKEGEILNNGEKNFYSNVAIEAIPMYNLTEERLNFHEKGRGNGYVITLNEKRIYTKSSED